MHYLNVDIESYSSENLAKSGVYRYCEAEDFEILLFGYSVDGGPVQVVDLARGERIPQDILEALTDASVVKWAFNAAFERICLSRYLGLPSGTYLDPSSWRCTMIWSAYLGLPLSLIGVGAVLGLEKQKLSEGKDLIRYFCIPCAPTITNGGRRRNRPADAPDKWNLFVEYNKRDVEVELAIHQRLGLFPVPDAIWDEYHLDQRINDRGVLIDRELVKRAIEMDSLSRHELVSRMKELTDLENPNSVSQVRTWLAENGLEVDSLGKKDVIAALDGAPREIKEVLELRLGLSKSSIRKYQAMENAACSDDRARGLFQFYGAARTGRWSGRQIQAQNLKRNSIEDIAVARALVKSGDYEAVKLLYGDVPDTLSQLVRTAFIPRKDHRFIVSDFSAIEARVLSWLAGEKWRMDIFSENGDIYCATASRMFHCEVTKHGENGHLRQKGKQAELACIAEGQLVLTDQGLVPIKGVTTDHRLWDGESWVSHEGVIFKGIREVITYGGLTATADHPVWVEGVSQPVTLGVATKYGAFLARTADGKKAIALGSHQGKREAHGSNDAPKVLRACNVYDILNAGTHHRFTVSGVLVHNCGYGGSVGALKAMGALESGMTADELKPLVDAWRQSNPNIVKLWWDVDKAVKEVVKDKTTTTAHGIRFSYESGFLFITLPSGRRLAYVKPRIGTNAFGSDCVTYEGVGGTKKWERIETYGPKLVENCLAEGTLVLAERGFVPIQEIRTQDRVWDGVEWVTHEGLIDKGIQETVRIGRGLEMTANHKILTTEGWRECVTTEGLEWADVQLPDGYQQGGEYGPGEGPMAVQVQVRESEGNRLSGPAGKKVSGEIVRMHEEDFDIEESYPAWNEPSSGIRCLACDEAALHGSEPPCVEELRGKGDTGVRCLAAQLRAVLGRHGADLPARIGFGQKGQQSRLRCTELSLGGTKGQLQEQEVKPCDRDSLRGYDGFCPFGIDRHRCDDNPVSHEQQLADRIAVHSTGCKKQVYDLANCGPGHCFAVWDGGAGKARIVSNCTQAISRDLLCHAMQQLGVTGGRIVMHIHDEVVIEAPKAMDVDEVGKIMSIVPSWAEGLILGAEGYEAEFYRKS
jgi:DNA polymerase